MAEQVGRPPREGVGLRRGGESEAVEPVEAALRRALELSDCVLRKTMNSNICCSWQKLTPKLVFYVEAVK